jgi:hypothetical protein
MAAPDLSDLLAKAAEPIKREFDRRLSERVALEKEHERLLAEHRARIEPVERVLRELADAYHRVTGAYPDGYRRRQHGPDPQARRRRGSVSSGVAITPEIERRIIDLARARGQVSAREVGEELDLLVDNKVPAALSHHLRAMSDDGRLRRTGEKRATRYGL